MDLPACSYLAGSWQSCGSVCEDDRVWSSRQWPEISPVYVLGQLAEGFPPFSQHSWRLVVVMMVVVVVVGVMMVVVGQNCVG